MGSGKQYDGVRAASASTIEIDFYYAGARCRERIKLEPTPANLKRASQHRAAVLDAIERGVFDYATTFPDSPRAKTHGRPSSSSLTVTRFLTDWLERKKLELKSSTWDDYRKIVNGLLIPGFGDMQLATVTRAHVRTWCAKQSAGNKRIGNILSVFRSALEEAAEDEIIAANPLAGWTYKKLEAPKEEDEVDPFTTKEQAAVLERLEGQGRNLIQFAFWTGLRTSELVALNWADIDLEAGVVRVRKASTTAAIKRARLALEPGGEVGAVEKTKTTAGRRDVKLLGPALAAVEAQKAFTFLAGAEVFQNPRTGERWGGDGPIRKTLWIGALKLAGVRYRNPYQTRHTYASMMLSAGEHPMWVAQQMGHRDWGMIRRIYGRFIPDADPTAGNRAEAVFGALSPAKRAAR